VEDTAATAGALAFYAPGLIGYSAVKIAVPSFYALRDSRTPVMVSIATVLLNVALNISLASVMGFRGLALGTAIAAMFNATTLLVILRRKLGGLDGSLLAVSLLKITAASIVMGLAAWGADSAIAAWMPARTVPVLGLRVAVSIGLALIVLDRVAQMLRIEEFLDARQALVDRLARVRHRG
jgi:putative peptidoglycan lipid II flippase